MKTKVNCFTDELKLKVVQEYIEIPVNNLLVLPTEKKTPKSLDLSAFSNL